MFAQPQHSTQRILWLILFALIGCEGSFSLGVELTWPVSEPGETETTFFSARVEERPDGALPVVLSQAPSLAYAPGGEVQLPNVPFGKERFLVLEVRCTETATAAVIYRGESSPFDVQEGASVAVPVAMMPTFSSGTSVDACSPNQCEEIGIDTDLDGEDDGCDPDIDNDGILNDDDSAPADRFVCRDFDNDTGADPLSRRQMEDIPAG